MDLISDESIRRPEVSRWHERIIERYTPPSGIALTVLLPCSARKPYSKSKSHMAFISQINAAARGRYAMVHEVTLTSPLGLVPRELERVYPAAHYDVPVTGFWSREEKDIVIRLLKDYLSKSGTTPVGHFGGIYSEICAELGINSTDGIPEVLEKMVKDALKDIKTVRSDRSRREVKAVLDFQFGTGTCESMLGHDFSKKGFQIHDSAQELIATIDRYTGYMALTLRGGEKLLASDRHVVRASFKPDTNSIFCAGIHDADPTIRPGDEIVLEYEGRAVGVGRAVLNGEEMVKAKKGLGVLLRHRGA